MILWKPYLTELFGESPDAVNKIKSIIKITDILSEDNLKVQDKLYLLRYVKKLDTDAQIFIFPWLIKLISDPAAPIRFTIFEIINELFSGFIPNDNIRDITNKPANIDYILQEVKNILINESDMELNIKFTDLSVIKKPVFALSIIIGINHYLIKKEKTLPPIETIQQFIDEENSTMKSILYKWLLEGPVYIRFLIVYMMSETNVSVSPYDSDVCDILRSTYEKDIDPLIAGHAIESYAQCTNTEELEIKKAVNYLKNEYSTLENRNMAWRDEYNYTDIYKIISISLFRAITILAYKFTDNVDVLELLNKIVTSPPVNNLSLFTGDYDNHTKEHILTAALHLFGPEVNIEIRPEKIKKKM